MGFFQLNICNGTDHDLVVESSSLMWGVWFTSEKDNTEPVGIPAGATVTAIGLKTSEDTWTGYACRCRWVDENDPSYGAISLYVDVPFLGGNRARLSTEGDLLISGWRDLPWEGHTFVGNVTITKERNGKLNVILDNNDSSSQSSIDQGIYTYYRQLYTENPDVTSWETVCNKLPEVDNFSPAEYILPHYTYPLAKPSLARSPVLAITDPTYIQSIGDPKYPSMYAKDLFVDRYFAVAVHSFNTNPRYVLSLRKGNAQTLSRAANVNSLHYHALNTHWSLNTALHMKSPNPGIGIELASMLDEKFGVFSVLEESMTRVGNYDIKQTFKATDHNLLVVPWVFLTAVLLYRMEKGQTVGLVAISEYADSQINYPYEF